jgi:hypothetical protein
MAVRVPARRMVFKKRACRSEIAAELLNGFMFLFFGPKYSTPPALQPNVSQSLLLVLAHHGLLMGPALRTCSISLMYSVEGGGNLKIELNN